MSIKVLIKYKKRFQNLLVKEYLHFQKVLVLEHLRSNLRRSINSVYYTSHKIQDSNLGTSIKCVQVLTNTEIQHVIEKFIIHIYGVGKCQKLSEKVKSRKKWY